MTERRPAVFFDRDGVLNHDHGFVHKAADFHWIDGAVKAIARLNRLGYLVFVVTNQSGIARGMYGEEAVAALHAWMAEDAARAGARIDDFRYCPHLAEGTVPQFAVDCDCRKPMPGMLLSLMAAWPVDPARSFLVGDRRSDLDAAQAAGIPGHLFEGGDLAAFVETVLSGKVARLDHGGGRR